MLGYSPAVLPVNRTKKFRTAHQQTLMDIFHSFNTQFTDSVLNMVSFVVILFCILTIVGIFILRKKMPGAERPYKAFGYPALPILYIIMGTAFCTLLIVFQPTYTTGGLIIALIGIPLYFIAVARKK